MIRYLKKGDKVKYIGGMNSFNLVDGNIYTVEYAEKREIGSPYYGKQYIIHLKDYPFHGYHAKYFEKVEETNDVKIKCDDSFKKIEQGGYFCEFDKVILEKDGHVTVYLKGCKVDKLTSVKYSASLDEISELEMKVRG